MPKSKLLVAASLLLLPCAMAADRRHKQPMSRHQKDDFTAFAYSAGSKTATGNVPAAGRTIAADPRVLPLGSRVRISGAGPYSGEYHVGDVGPSMKGNKIDVFVASRAEAIQFGRRNVIVTVLSTPPRPPDAESARTRVAQEAEPSSTYGLGTY